MAALPLAIRLKRRNQRSVALAQDIMVAQAYDSFPDCVLHGGTAIWRCYGGGRFSEDVDLYIPTFSDSSADRFRRGLAAKGMEQQKFKATANTLFGRFSLSGASVAIEGALRRPPGRTTMSYELLGGGYMLVATLPAEELVIEKAEAYLDRRKIRDLYDVFFLLGRVEDRPRVAKSLLTLARGWKEPVDEPQLKATVLMGVVPSAEEMTKGILKWARKYT